MFHSLFRLCVVIIIIAFLTAHYPGLWMHLATIILSSAHTMLDTTTHLVLGTPHLKG